MSRRPAQQRPAELRGGPRRTTAKLRGGSATDPTDRHGAADLLLLNKSSDSAFWARFGSVLAMSTCENNFEAFVHCGFDQRRSDLKDECRTGFER